MSGPRCASLPGDPAIAGLPSGPLTSRDNEDGTKAEVDIPANDAFVAALRNATTLTVIADNGPLDPISLSGAVAALLWIDEQHRADVK
jgi:hypothetical protein